jgi:hypothetical protein
MTEVTGAEGTTADASTTDNHYYVNPTTRQFVVPVGGSDGSPV